jgi:serine/threonine protein kinase
MAQVYLARDVRLGREVAVKVLDRRLADRSGFRERFLREARVAAALDHPNIVPLFDFGEENGVLYLVMPYISGGSLQDQLSRVPLSMAEVVTYGSQLTDALAYAHKRHLVHRDVKPANILIHADGRLMLSDFGLAKILDSGLQPAAARNRPDAGTPEYMAPEQIEGRTEARSDLYGLGVVLYLFMTGRLPFTGSSSSAVMEAHLYRLPESPRRINPEVTQALEIVVLQALAKRPEDRFATATEMGAALMAALVAGETSPLPFSNPISPLPFTSLPPMAPPVSHEPMPLPTISPAPQVSGSGMVVEADPGPAFGSEYGPGYGQPFGHISGRGHSGATAGPAPHLDPALPNLEMLANPGAPAAMPYAGQARVSPAPGPLGASGGGMFPSGNSEAPRGISGPQALSFPAAQQPGAPLTYRAGEDSRLRAGQSRDPMDPRGYGSLPHSFPQSMPQPSGIGGVSGVSAASSGIRPVPSTYSSPGTRGMGRQSGSRLWIVAVIILAVLAIAAIVLLRMAQTGVFLSL